jgi:hypothetical protein
MKNPKLNSASAAAELALKAHVLQSTRQILAELPDGARVLKHIGRSVNLTEAPEDAVCSLVTDLLHYCEREKIDWRRDVMARAHEQFRGNCSYCSSTASTGMLR